MLIKYSTYIRNYFETHQLEAWIPVLNKNATPGLPPFVICSPQGAEAHPAGSFRIVFVSNS